MHPSLFLLLLAPLRAPQGPGAPTPSGRVSFEPDPAAVDDQWIRFDLWQSAYIFLQGTVNGTDAEMLLDTESGMTALNLALTARLGFPSAARDARGEYAGTGLGPLELGIGSRKVTLPRALALDLGGPCSALGRDAPVLLGRDVLDRFVLDLDYPRRRLSLMDPEGFVHEGEDSGLALSTNSGAYRVEAQVEDEPPAPFRIDTGCRGLLLRAQYLEEHRSLGARHTRSRTVILRSFTVGPCRFRDVPATIIDSPLPAGAPAEVGSIGGELLARFRVTINAPRERLWLEPASDWNSRPFVRNRLGLEVVCRGASLEVSSVTPGSPAEKDGWKPGDRILAVDGEPITPSTWKPVFLRGAESPAGTEIVLTGGDGRMHRLIAADFE